MRRLVAGLVLVALFAITGVLQVRRDAGRDASSVESAWHAVGGRLVTLQSAGVVEQHGLRCFRYGLSAPNVDRRTLCFTAGGRLVTALHETRTQSRLATVLPDTDRAPVELAPERIELDARRVETLGVLRSSTSASISALAACAIASETLRSHVESSLAGRRVPRTLLTRAARDTSASCRRAYGQIQAYGKPLERWDSLRKLVKALRSRANELASVAERYEPSTRSVPPKDVVQNAKRTYRYRERLIIRRARRDVVQLRRHTHRLVKRLVG